MEDWTGPMNVASEARAAFGRLDVLDDAPRQEEATGVDDSSPRRPVPGGLDDRGQRILDFERRWWQYAGAKEQAARDLFGLSPTRYYQVLNALIDTEPALQYDPMLVKRLRRMRATRQRARGARRLEGI